MSALLSARGKYKDMAEISSKRKNSFTAFKTSTNSQEEEREDRGIILSALIRKSSVLLLLGVMACDRNHDGIRVQKPQDNVVKLEPPVAVSGVISAQPNSSETPEEHEARILKEMIKETFMETNSCQRTQTRYLQVFPYHVLKFSLEMLKSSSSNRQIPYKLFTSLIQRAALTRPGSLKTNFPDVKNEKDLIELFLQSMEIWHKEDHANQTIQNFAKNYPLQTLLYFPRIAQYFNKDTMTLIASIIAQKCPADAKNMPGNYENFIAPTISAEIKNMVQRNIGGKQCLR